MFLPLPSATAQQPRVEGFNGRVRILPSAERRETVIEVRATIVFDHGSDQIVYLLQHLEGSPMPQAWEGEADLRISEGLVAVLRKSARPLMFRFPEREFTLHIPAHAFEQYPVFGIARYQAREPYTAAEIRSLAERGIIGRPAKLPAARQAAARRRRPRPVSDFGVSNDALPAATLAGGCDMLVASMERIHDPAALASICKQIRRHIITMTGAAKSGHPGGSLSAVEIVVTLYWDVMRHDPARPDWPDRDRFILSKGHAAPVLYAALAECGYTPKETLNTLRKLGSIYQGHPDKRFLPALEASTGSLGEGLSVGIGMALAARLDGKDYRTYVLLGDGEIQEGQIWEAAMFASFRKVDNLCAIVDYNKLQLDGFVKEILDLEPLADKWRAFGWHVIELDGHDIPALQKAFAEAASTKGKPTVIIAHTVKGKGVSFMENNPKYHGVAPTPEEVELALKELA